MESKFWKCLYFSVSSSGVGTIAKKINAPPRKILRRGWIARAPAPPPARSLCTAAGVTAPFCYQAQTVWQTLCAEKTCTADTLCRNIVSFVPGIFCLPLEQMSPWTFEQMSPTDGTWFRMNDSLVASISQRVKKQVDDPINAGNNDNACFAAVRTLIDYGNGSRNG